jgi:hypothetical protein
MLAGCGGVGMVAWGVGREGAIKMGESCLGVGQEAARAALVTPSKQPPPARLKTPPFTAAATPSSSQGWPRHASAPPLQGSWL